MARLPDLVRDSKLETQFKGDTIIHTYDESDSASLRRSVSRTESWQREKQIGTGGFGNIWLEKCTRGTHTGSLRATKQIKTVHGKIKRLDCNRELEIIAKFSQRKYERCFVKSFGWFEDSTSLFIAMEYLELGDLQDYQIRMLPLPENEVREITYQILDGLNFMHDHGFAHRDLKPNNILLRSHPPKEWWIKIADFGLSKRIEEGLGSLSTVKGTLGFLAPELHGFIERGTPYSADMWALGETAHRLLTKAPTFGSLGLLSVYAQNRTANLFPSEAMRKASVSAAGLEFIMAVMCANPAKRLKTAAALQHSWIEQRSTTPRASGKTNSNVNKFKLYCSVDTDEAGTALAFSPDGRALAAGEDYIQLWDVRTGQLIRKIDAREHPSVSKAFSSDGRLIVSGSDITYKGVGGAKIVLYDVKGGKMVRVIESQAQYISSVMFSPDDTVIAASTMAEGKDHFIELWSTSTGQLIRTLRGHSDSIYDIAFSPDGKMLASASGDTTIRLWDPKSGKQIRVLLGHEGNAASFHFSPDGMLLVYTGGHDRLVTLYDVATETLVRQFVGHLRYVYCAVFSPDGTVIASASSDNTVILWDTMSGEKLRTLRDPMYGLCSVEFSPDGTTIASGCSYGRVRLWKLTT